MDLDTNCFLTAVAHSCVIFTTFFNRHEHIVASLPPLGVVAGISPNFQKMLFVDTDASFCVVLALSLAFLASECIIYFAVVHPPHVQMFFLIGHAIACVCLLKFSLDAHPVHHFWWLFALINCPITISQIGILILRHCCPIGRTNNLKIC